MLGDVRRYGNYFVAVIFFTVGLLLLDAIRMPLPGAAQPGMKRKGVLAGTFTEVVQRYLHWTGRFRGAVIVKRVCGALVLLGGLYLIYTAR